MDAAARWGFALGEAARLSPFWEAMHFTSDLAIGLSYVAISGTILYLLSRAGAIPFHWIFVAFGGFIVCCGIGHLMHVAVVANGANWPWLAVAQTFTVVASVSTAVALPWQVPRILDLIRAAREGEQRQVAMEMAKAEAEAANRAKSDFLANMSHELRTPLTAILGFNELLRDDVISEPDERRAAFDDVQNAGEHLVRLINDVLDMAKVEAGQMAMALTSVDLTKALHTCVALVRDRVTERSLTLDVTLEAMPPVFADERKLTQVVVNLLSNAVKFTPAGGNIALTARREGAVVAIAVADTGIGISEADQAKLFRPFSQVDGSLSRRHEGTGLGLALTRRLVELHGGTIVVESAPGRGSTFTVRLPVVSAQPEAGGAATPAPPQKEVYTASPAT